MTASKTPDEIRLLVEKLRIMNTQMEINTLGVRIPEVDEAADFLEEIAHQNDPASTPIYASLLNTEDKGERHD